MRSPPAGTLGARLAAGLAERCRGRPGSARAEGRAGRTCGRRPAGQAATVQEVRDVAKKLKAAREGTGERVPGRKGA